MSCFVFEIPGNSPGISSFLSFFTLKRDTNQHRNNPKTQQSWFYVSLEYTMSRNADMTCRKRRNVTYLWFAETLNSNVLLC